MFRRSAVALYTLALSLAAATPSRLSAQAEAVPAPDCPTRVCVSDPCPQPPCRMDGRVVRTGREVRVTLEGRILRYEVTERWTNRGRALGEVDYVLPLPRGAAFENLSLMIDGEMVNGEIRGAGEARRIYEEIVRRQRDPALVEWMDHGVLRTRIFPIQPGETRTVTVRFNAIAEREGDALRVDVPAPRGQGTENTGTQLSFQWPEGNGYGEAWSPTHRVEDAGGVPRRSMRVVDATGTVTLLLPVRSNSAAVTVLTHAPRTDEGYMLLTLGAPARASGRTARDVTFVIDISGSMSGEKLTQAKAAGRQLLNSLAGVDRFRLIAFSGDVNDFAESWSEVTPATLRRAQEWLDGLSANGGTNIGGALERALEVATPANRLGLVLFLTDGAPTVGERDAAKLAARAAQLRGERRVFTFGLGADLNATLLEQLALDGAGTAHFVRPQEDVERVVAVVAQRLTRPVATDIRIRAQGVTLQQVMPAGRIDLFAGQELTILARYTGSAESARITVTGQHPDGAVTWTTNARFPAQRTQDAFVGRLWATQRVGWLSAERRKNGASTELDNEIKQLGERWGIPTAFTSYLVLEPGMIAPSPASISSAIRADPTRRGARERILDSPNSISMVGGDPSTRAAGAGTGAGSGAPSAPPPQAAFEDARRAASQRASRSVADADGELRGEQTRRTASRMFVLRDSVWTDSRAKAAQSRTVRVRPYSDAYFALMNRTPELREVFALGERVEAHGRAVTVVLAADGAERLSAADVDAITRDW